MQYRYMLPFFAQVVARPVRCDSCGSMSGGNTSCDSLRLIVDMQAAAGALEELRRSATPDADADPHEPPPPALLPALKGKRSRTKRTAHATTAASDSASDSAAVAAAEAVAAAPADAIDQSGKAAARPQCRVSVHSRAGAANGSTQSLPQQDSAAHSAASASTAAGSCGPDSAAAGGLQEGKERSEHVQLGQAGPGSKAQGRRKSRLSKASSPTPEPSPVPDAAAEPPAKQRGLPARRGSAKQPPADQGQTADDNRSSRPKRKSGTDSTAVKAGDAVASETGPEHAAGSGSTQCTVAEDISAGKASSGRARAKRKSVETPSQSKPLPAATWAGRRGSKGGQSASEQAETTTVVHVAPAVPPGDDSAKPAPASKASMGSCGKGTAVQSYSQATAAAAEAKPAASSRKSRGSKGTGNTAGPSKAAAAEEEEAGPSVQAGGSHAAAEKVGGQAKAAGGKRSWQSLEDAPDDGPAGGVKAARKATDSK